MDSCRQFWPISILVLAIRRSTARKQTPSSWLRPPSAELEHIEIENPRGLGNIVFAELVYENITVVFTGFGKVGVTSEKVADGVVRAVRKYLKLNAPVGPHLADQLILPMAIAAHFSNVASQFRTGPLTQHSITHADIIKKFLNVDVVMKNDDPDNSRSAVTVSAQSRAK